MHTGLSAPSVGGITVSIVWCHGMQWLLVRSIGIYCQMKERVGSSHCAIRHNLIHGGHASSVAIGSSDLQEATA